MADPVIANVLKSGAIVWTAAEGTAVPDETTVVFGAAWGGVWTRVGYTKEPLSFLYEDERAEISVEEFLGPVKVYRIKESVKIETVLAELEADYLAYMLDGTVAVTAAGAGQKGFEELPVGNDPTPAVRAWGFEGMMVDSAGTSQPIRFFIPRGHARLNGALEFSQKSDDYIGVPLQVSALVDTTTSKIFTFQRVTAPATS